MLKYENINIGLLIIRIGIGLALAHHGWPKLLKGPEGWHDLGGAMKVFGITFLPVFWGFMAMFSEFGCGILVALGIAWKPACALVFITMLVATVHHIADGDKFGDYSHALELTVLFAGLFFTGAGKYKLLK